MAYNSFLFNLGDYGAMSILIEAFEFFFKPITRVFLAIISLISFLVGALLNPQGFLNQIICSVIDYIAFIFPSTPDNLKVSSIINGLASAMPLVGLTLIVKIYKLIPFKAT